MLMVAKNNARGPILDAFSPLAFGAFPTVGSATAAKTCVAYGSKIAAKGGQEGVRGAAGTICTVLPRLFVTHHP